MRRIIISNVAAGYSLLVGGWETTVSHQHFAVHLSLTHEGLIAIRVEGEQVETAGAWPRFDALVPTCWTRSCRTMSSSRSSMPRSADELAASLGMSTGRFLHLFRLELGIIYRRMEIWIRLAKAVAAFERFDSLTDLSHEFGFSDSGHFSRAFKETFVQPLGVLRV